MEHEIHTVQILMKLTSDTIEMERYLSISQSHQKCNHRARVVRNLINDL